VTGNRPLTQCRVDAGVRLVYWVPVALPSAKGCTLPEKESVLLSSVCRTRSSSPVELCVSKVWSRAVASEGAVRCCTCA
jgi:hypothetical protein